MGVFWVFSRCGASLGFLTRYDGEFREPLVWCQGSQASMRVGRGSASLLSSHGRGIGPQDMLNKASRGLSRIAAGNPGFPQLVPVTSGSFSVCLREVRDTVELGGASRGSTGFGAMEEWRQEPQGSSPFLTRITGSLQSRDKRVTPRLLWRNGSPLAF